MKIQIGGLSDGLHHYSFRVASSELGLGAQFVDDVSVDATLDKSSTQILLTSTITATGQFECDRCVAPFTKRLEGSYSMFYIPEGSEATQLDPVEVQVVPSGMHLIDLSDDVRQTILLSVPFKLLCKESCKGLCPTCGKNLNEETCSCSVSEADSRWEKLRKLQSN